MGQARAVVVKRFVVRDTVEERILALQTRKHALAHTLLGGAGAAALRDQRLDDLKTLFGL